MPRIIDPQRCLIIGEVAQSHDGSLGTAHAFIDAIANAGADAVKFQTHIAAAESTLRCCHGSLCICFIAPWNQRPRLAGVGIERLEPVAAGRIAPLAIDI